MAKVFFFITVVFALLLMFHCHPGYSQMPEPDTPFVPYLDVDATPEKKKCDQVVEIVEPSDIRTICWEDTNKLFAEDGETVEFMLLPKGCVAVVQYRLKLQLDVYQDRTCDILFHNKGVGFNIKEKEQKPIESFLQVQSSIGHEFIGSRVIPEGSDLNHDLVISGSKCPFILNLKYELDYFQAECENVDFNDERIILPIGCRFTMELVGKDRGRIEHQTCPTILVFQHGWMDGA